MPRPQPKPGVLDIAPYVGGKSAAPKHAGLGRTVKLSSNESPLGPSPLALEAYAQASATLHRYPDGGHTKLREALAEVHGLEMDRIVCGAGSDELIAFLVNAYCLPGDDIVMSRHGFLMYKIYAQAAGAGVVMAPEKNLTCDVDALLAAVTPRTKILFLANPNNPTGTYLPGAELRRLRRALPEHILLAIDGAYTEYVDRPDYEDGIALARETENTVVLRTFSKIYALPALRIGWAYGPAAIVDVLNRVRGPFNLCSPAIVAGAAAVRDAAHLERSRAHNTTWCPWLEEQFRALGLIVTPSVGNFILAEFPASGKTAAAANAYLMERGLIIRDVMAYGLPNHLRATVGLEEENRALIEALAAFLK